jgi:hypothetical protein
MVVAIVVDSLAPTRAIVPLALGSPVVTLDGTRARASNNTNATKTKALAVVCYLVVVAA